jgi:uncharacterized protein YecE (DUF72 family)
MIYHLGTSGWSYPGWRGLFYPEGLPAKDWLAFYAEHFSTIEINMTFYRYPKAEMFKTWIEKTPAHFTFTLKANRQITHFKRLKNVHHEVHYFYILAHSLREKLGCILFQLPPSIAMDLSLLEEFLGTLSPDYKNVIEFRHQSWYSEKVHEALRAHNVTFCVVSSARVPHTVVQTAETAYFRFHGLTGGYRYNYSDEELRMWANAIKTSGAKEAYVYFNNDYQAFAVSNCLKLQEFLKE